MSTAELVAKLKDEGNVFFLKKDYASAAAKYTEAIKIDGENAILYSNRAACRLNLKTYLDAASDAKRATEIDPTFAKAYARLASAQDAMREPNRSVESWEKAVSNLPKDNLTLAQLNQKAEYEKGLIAAKAAMSDIMNTTNHLIQKSTTDAPWICAKRKIPLLTQQGNYTSSAWALAGAYGDFTEGVRQIFAAKTEGVMRFQITGALALISNAILTDQRVFHIADPNFIQKYNEQILGEIQFYNAWTEEGPDSIKQKVRQRLREQGWDAVRPAITTTIQGWIMQGFYQGGMFRNNIAEREYLTRAIEVIKWIREEYSDVRKEYRGAIFEETFLRGVQTLHLGALLKSMQNADDATIDAAIQEANEVIGGVDASPIPPRESDPSFVSAFYYHAKGQALSLKAICYRNKGNQIRAKQDFSLYEPMLKNFTLAKQYYLEAADCFAEDDENHAVFLNAALDMMWSSKTNVRDQLAVMERIRLAIPKMNEIWAHSVLAVQGRDRMFKRGLEMEIDLRQGVESGKFQLDDFVTLQFED